MDLEAAASDPNVTLRLFLTGGAWSDGEVIDDGQLPNATFGRRMIETDFTRALDGYKNSIFGAAHDRAGTVAYVCGPPKMTDEIVEFLVKQPGISERQVRCEKWW